MDFGTAELIGGLAFVEENDSMGESLQQSLIALVPVCDRLKRTLPRYEVPIFFCHRTPVVQLDCNGHRPNLSNRRIVLNQSLLYFLNDNRSLLTVDVNIFNASSSFNGAIELLLPLT